MYVHSIGGLVGGIIYVASVIHMWNMFKSTIFVEILLNFNILPGLNKVTGGVNSKVVKPLGDKGEGFFLTFSS